MFAMFLAGVVPVHLTAQEVTCESDSRPPTIGSARASLSALNYPCAEKELVRFLAMETVTLEQKADAHLLLGTIYYLMLVSDTEQRRQRAKQQFLDACRAYCEWRGGYDDITQGLEYDLPELRDVLQEARLEVVCPEPPADTAAVVKKGKSKLKWILAAAGVVAVGTVVALASGGDDGASEPVDRTVPDFPDPPQ